MEDEEEWKNENKGETDSKKGRTKKERTKREGINNNNK
jgi:hypothetical protein